MDDKEKIKKIVGSLSQVPDEYKQTVLDMAKENSDDQIVSEFNQISLDFFSFLIELTRKRNQESEFGIQSYLNLFNTAIFISKKLPIDQFSVIVLQYAHKIYSKDENYLLSLHMPDKEIRLQKQTEFSLLQTDKFKKLWSSLRGDDKNKCGDLILLLTTYSHAYFYKTIMSQIKQ